MIYKAPLLKGTLTLLTLLATMSLWAQTPMPSYYYSNAQPKSLKGVTLEFSPFSKPLLGIEESYKPSFLDVSLGYNIVLIPGSYRATFAPEFYFFGSYASYQAKEDSLIYPVEVNGALVDYGKLALSNLTMFRGGAQVIFWNNTAKKLQLGPGLGISVGQYSYDYYGKAKPDSSLIEGDVKQTFVMFSPSFGAKYWIKDNLGVYLNLAYNAIVETQKKDSELDVANPDLTKAYATFTPRIGVFYTFKKR